jgi:hypothetical protein
MPAAAGVHHRDAVTHKVTERSDIKQAQSVRIFQREDVKSRE